MKRYIVVAVFVVLLVVLVVALVVISSNEHTSDKTVSRFIQIGVSKGGPGSYGIVYMDRETKVLYLKCDGYKREAMTVLFDTNSPLVYNDEIPEDRTKVIISFNETYSTYYGGYIYVDEDRNVVYLYDDGYQRASITVLLKADGKPILYENK